jgi:hypothetical protein
MDSSSVTPSSSATTSVTDEDDPPPGTAVPGSISLDGRMFRLSVTAARGSAPAFGDMGAVEGPLEVSILVDAADRRTLPSWLAPDKIWVRGLDVPGTPVWRSALASWASADEANFGTAPHVSAVASNGPPWNGRIDAWVRVGVAKANRYFCVRPA